MDRTAELKNCTSIKTVLMLVIVLFHSMLAYAGEGWGPHEITQSSIIFKYLSDFLSSFHVYAFTLVSGYIFYHIKFEKGGYSRYPAFLWNKVKRLLLPYAFIVLIWIVPVRIYFYGTEGLLSRYVLGTNPSQLWFLLMLFWVFAIFWPLSGLMDRKPLLGAIIVCLLYGAGLFFPAYFCLYKGLQFILFFSIGFWIRKYDLGNRILYRIPSVVYWIVYPLLFGVTTWVSGMEGTAIKVLALGMSTVLYMVGAVTAFVLLQKLTARWLQNSRILRFLSEHSMVIYLVHQQLIFFSIGWIGNGVPSIIAVTVNFVFALVLSTAFSVLMSRTKLTRLLVGGK